MEKTTSACGLAYVLQLEINLSYPEEVDSLSKSAQTSHCCMVCERKTSAETDTGMVGRSGPTRPRASHRGNVDNLLKSAADLEVNRQTSRFPQTAAAC